MIRLAIRIIEHHFFVQNMRRLIIKIGLAVIVLGFCGLCALGAYYVLFLWLVRVPTGSMANTIIPGDHLVVKKRAFGEIGRGDLVIFMYPKDPSVNYVSRVVALPSEVVQVRGRIVYINDKELMEQRVTVKPDVLHSGVLEELSSDGAGSYRVFFGSREEDYQSILPSELDVVFGGTQPFRVPENHYFVMGDNRDNSHDSRFWGPVPRESIMGKPFMIYWSANPHPSGAEEMRWERLFTKIN